MACISASSAIVEHPPVLLRDGNVIAEGFDDELDELRKIRDQVRDSS